MTEPQLKPGDQLDKYTIVGLLATGGMGDVYEAVHRFTKRPAAIKCLRHAQANGSDLRERMRAEAEVLCELEHSNVVKVYDADVTPEGMVWMAMERLVGQTLREHLHRRGRLRVARALHYAAEIADGVAAAHGRHVVHRDLKPENVFVTRSAEIKVLDLGTAKFSHRGLKVTDQKRLLGTPYYMSPEHLLGQGVDGRADVYAVGLMLYEMLAGHHPFARGPGNAGLPGSAEVGAFQIHVMPPPLTARIPELPQDVWALVERAIAKDREQRFARMADLRDHLRAARRRLLEHAHATGTLHLYADPAQGEDLPERKAGAKLAPRFHTERLAPLTADGPPPVLSLLPAMIEDETTVDTTTLSLPDEDDELDDERDEEDEGDDERDDGEGEDDDAGAGDPTLVWKGSKGKARGPRSAFTVAALPFPALPPAAASPRPRVYAAARPGAAAGSQATPVSQVGQPGIARAAAPLPAPEAARPAEVAPSRERARTPAPPRRGRPPGLLIAGAVALGVALGVGSVGLWRAQKSHSAAAPPHR